MKFYTMLQLYQGPKYGYEVLKNMRERLNLKVGPEQIYPFLKKLENYKYVKSQEAGERDKKVYYLTKEGKAFVRRMLERFGDLIDIAIEPRLTVCAHCACKIYEGGHKEKVGDKELMFCCKHCALAYKSERSWLRKLFRHEH